MDKTKEVVIGGRQYVIAQMTALVASRVYGWLTSSSAKLAQSATGEAKDDGQVVPTDPEEFAEGMVKFAWMIAAPSGLNEEACEKIQRYALACCSYTDKAGIKCPIFMPNGQPTDPELAATVINHLIVASLQFSIAPFFAEGLASTPTPKN